jgi:hypothetical protein
LTEATTFDDASRVTPSAGTPLRVAVSDDRRFVLNQGIGRAGYSVTPGGRTQWEVVAGRVFVDVIGTEFRVVRSETAVDVTVDHGIVVVRGPDGAQRLADGESAHIVVADAVAEATVAPAAPVAHGPAVASSTSMPEWRRAALRGDYREGYEALGPSGVQTLVADRADVETLLAAADAARLAGHPAEAAVALEAVIDRREGGPHGAAGPSAAFAAFTLARVRIDGLHDRKGGRAALERSLALGLSGTLREACYLRLIELADEGGDRDAVRQAFLREFPGHEEKVRALQP